MIDSIVDIAKQHGTWAAACTLLTFGLYKVDQRARENSQKLATVHDGCPVTTEALNNLKLEVDEMKKVDHVLETRFASIEGELKRFDNVESMLTEVLLHLSKKGLDK